MENKRACMTPAQSPFRHNPGFENISLVVNLTPAGRMKLNLFSHHLSGGMLLNRLHIIEYASDGQQMDAKI